MQTSYILGTPGTSGEFCPGCSLGEKINAAYAGYAASTTPVYMTGFKSATQLVDTFLTNPSQDPTNGAIHFVHAASPHEAQAIADRIQCLGQSYIEDVIRGAGVEPFTNPDDAPMNVGAIKNTVFINMNYTPNLRLELYPVCGSASCPGKPPYLF